MILFRHVSATLDKPRLNPHKSHIAPSFRFIALEALCISYSRLYVPRMSLTIFNDGAVACPYSPSPVSLRKNVFFAAQHLLPSQRSSLSTTPEFLPNLSPKSTKPRPNSYKPRHRRTSLTLNCQPERRWEFDRRGRHLDDPRTYTACAGLPKHATPKVWGPYAPHIPIQIHILPDSSTISL